MPDLLNLNNARIRFGLPRRRVSPLAFLLFAISIAAGACGTAAANNNPAPLIVGTLVGIYLLLAMKVADQWEKVAVLRLGKYSGLRGPGLFFIIPFVDEVTQFVDQRVRVTDVKAESALTRDTVPVNVDAIVFWLVWNAEKSLLEVSDFQNAISLAPKPPCASPSAVTN